MIVAFHSGNYAINMQSDLSICGKIISHLDIGVILFFVISGYCIAASAETHRGQEKSVKSFLTQRFRRIFPAYWGALLFALAVILFDRNFSPLNLSQWLGNITLIETWRPLFSQSKEVLLLPSAWSLCFEVQFYVLMALMLAFRANLILWAVAISGLTLSTMFLIGIPSVYRLFLDGHWLFFVAGVLVFYALHFQPKKLLWWKAGFYFVSLLLMVSGFIYRNDIIILLAVTTGFGLVLLMTSADDLSLSASWIAKPFMLCGKFSYSLYLVHIPICWILTPRLYALGLTSVCQTMFITMPICIAVSIIVAMGFCKLIEKPFAEPKRKAPKEGLLAISTLRLLRSPQNRQTERCGNAD